jgi:hypothetical protein
LCLRLGSRPLWWAYRKPKIKSVTETTRTYRLNWYERA